jgi:hypothetical protein
MLDRATTKLSFYISQDHLTASLNQVTNPFPPEVLLRKWCTGLSRNSLQKMASALGSPEKEQPQSKSVGCSQLILPTNQPFFF